MTSRLELINREITKITSNGLTPFMIVDITKEGVIVPLGYDVDGIITLDISGKATYNFAIDDSGISFGASFNGKAELVSIPLESIVAIVPKEGQPVDAPAQRPERKKPTLTIVK